MSLITTASSPSPIVTHGDQRPSTSMTLSISQKDALDMVEASKAFNKSLAEVKKKSLTNAGDDPSNDDNVVDYLIETASTCPHPLVQAFSRSLSAKPKAEIQSSLVLFLDTDKSTKLLTAFRIFHIQGNDTIAEYRQSESVKVEEDDKEFGKKQAVSPCPASPAINRQFVDNGEAKPMDTSEDEVRLGGQRKEFTSTSASQIDQSGLFKMFQCFLTAISMCIHDQRDTSSSSDTIILSPGKLTEIHDMCSHAASNLIRKLSSSNATKVVVTYEDFGEWYNGGGFELVPWLELLALPKWDHGCFINTTKSPPTLSAAVSSSPPYSVNAGQAPTTPTTASNSKCVVSFDFTGVSCDKPLHIDITEENLLLLKQVVTRTGLFRKSPNEMCNVILKHSSKKNGEIQKSEFGRCMRELIATNLNQEEIVTFSNFLVGLFSCFDRQGKNVVNAKELAAGLSFLSGGNKSNKLAIAFELLDENREGRLSCENLTRFLRSFLAVIVGISMPTSRLSREDMFHAVDNGASWTQSHVLNRPNKLYVTFDEFAEWYTEGGYTVAPWLELLDLSKFISLLEGENNIAGGPLSYNNNGYSTDITPSSLINAPLPNEIGHNSIYAPPNVALRTAHPHHPPKDVLFTFPLTNENELVVLKDDVFYVRSVVDQLGLIMVRPEDVWASLCKNVASSCFVPWSGSYEVDQNTFVNAVDDSVATLTGRRLDSNSKFTLSNFFSSYDLEQFNKVQLNQLMGGLALFCLGRKSAKLAFSFGLFDGRNNMSNPNSKACINDPSKKNETGAALNGDELFLFLRSFLIVLFSCCAQSLELTSDGVSLWIHDTSKMVCGNVMRFQWNAGKRCVNFDDFGVWYNQGGFEVAPWLELLDLNKWFLGQKPSQTHDVKPQIPAQNYPANGSPEALSPMADFPYDFVGEIEQMIGHDEKENFVNPSNGSSMPAPPRRDDNVSSSSSITFQLLTNDRDQGVMISITQMRVTSLRQLLTESGFCRIDASRFCSQLIMCSDKASGKLSKDQYDNAMRNIVAEIRVSMSPEIQQRLSDLLTTLFYAFDREKRAKVDAIEFAAGMTVLCGGRKSDKLEYAFELIDDDRDGKLARQGLWRFLRSFLTVLICLSSSDNIMKDERIVSAVDNGASWAVSQAFGPESNSRLISFDDFAAWYTKGGYSIIPWLELLDLKKWVIFS